MDQCHNLLNAVKILHVLYATAQVGSESNSFVVLALWHQEAELKSGSIVEDLPVRANLESNYPAREFQPKWNF